MPVSIEPTPKDVAAAPTETGRARPKNLRRRKRRLKFERAVQEGGREYWQVRLVSEQSEHKVLNPRLSEQEVQQLSEQLTAILSGDAEAIESLGEPNPAEPVGSEGDETSDAG